MLNLFKVKTLGQMWEKKTLAEDLKKAKKILLSYQQQVCTE